ncbi:MAG: AI-2E family transporter [Bacteroidota bacterium]|nr:AI-2E family transporter [Bacteroidota bacterium]
MTNNYSLDRIYKTIILLTIAVVFLYLARIILIPLAAAAVFSILIYPINGYLEKYMHRILATTLNLLIVTAVISGILYFFSTQLYHLFGNIENFWKQIENILNNLLAYFKSTFFDRFIEIDNLTDGDSGNLMDSFTFIINKTISSSAMFFSFLTLMAVYTFLFLIYRSSLKVFLLDYLFKQERSEWANDILNEVITVIRKYFLGLFLVIAIVGTLNGFGLWIIGLNYAFLFGYFAALLTIIPYIGTAVGGILPFLYAFINSDNLLTPFLVLLLYVGVQTFEGNVLTPKIVGSQASLNPLIAILSIIIGGVIWGIAGMILFVPFVAILKVVFDHIESTRPIGLLLSSKFMSSSRNKKNG